MSLLLDKTFQASQWLKQQIKTTHSYPRCLRHLLFIFMGSLETSEAVDSDEKREEQKRSLSFRFCSDETPRGHFHPQLYDGTTVRQFISLLWDYAPNRIIKQDQQLKCQKNLNMCVGVVCLIKVGKWLYSKRDFRRLFKNCSAHKNDTDVLLSHTLICLMWHLNALIAVPTAERTWPRAAQTTSDTSLSDPIPIMSTRRLWACLEPARESVRLWLAHSGLLLKPGGNIVLTFCWEQHSHQWRLVVKVGTPVVFCHRRQWTSFNKKIHQILQRGSGGGVGGGSWSGGWMVQWGRSFHFLSQYQ